MKVRWYFTTFAAFFLLSLGLYARSLGAFFVSDDWHWLQSAAHAQNIFSIFSTNYTGGTTGGSYNPVSLLVIDFLYRAFGLVAYPYHLASIMLHAFSATALAILINMLQSVFYPRAQGNRSQYASSAGVALLFLIWPTHVETVAWISSLPHLISGFLFLSTLIFYIVWRRGKKKSALFLSYVAGILAFMSKESTISLPFVILFFEIAYQTHTKQKMLVRRTLAAFGFFLEAFLFLVFRYGATGLLWGTYAESSVVVRPLQWLNTGSTYVVEFLSAGTLRNAWMSIYWERPLLVGALSVFFISTAAALILFKKKIGMRFAFLSLAVTIAPFIPLGFNRLSQEGERYTYLPSFFFFIFLAFGARKLPRGLATACVALLLVASAVLTVQKNNAWEIAGRISRTIVSDFRSMYSRFGPNVQYVFVGLPDTVSGAHVFRNNLSEALRMSYPDIPIIAAQVPVYTQLTRQNYSSNVLSWSSDDRGFFARSISGKNVVTGIDRRETNILTYELWNYDYTTFSSDTIRLILKFDFKERLLGGTAHIITYSGGHLMSLPFTGQ